MTYLILLPEREEDRFRCNNAYFVSRLSTMSMCKPYSFQFIRDRIFHGLAQATSHGPSLFSHSVGLSGEAVVRTLASYLHLTSRWIICPLPELMRHTNFNLHI